LSDAQVSDRQAGVLYPGSEARRGMLQRAADWADMLERESLVKISSYRGKGGIVSLLPRLASDNAGLVTV
jgi:hypothetical protein